MSTVISIKLVKLDMVTVTDMDLNINYDPALIEIISESKKFEAENIFQAFKLFNIWLQNNGWIPLCNGARLDASVSGLLLDSFGGASVYLLDELDDKGMPKLVDIFGVTTVDKVATIEQQEKRKNEETSKVLNNTHVKENQSTLKRFAGCLSGLACGDAVGTSVEFRRRGTFPELTDMVGGGPFNLLPGQWTDDTSMALCLAESLCRDRKKGEDAFDPNDQMQRYLRWRNEGYISSTGRCFDIGNTVAKALSGYEKTGNPYSGPTEIRSAGNGSIMRLAPIAMYYFNSLDDTAKFAELSSKTTHGAQEAVDACHLFSLMLNSALSGKPKDEILFNTNPLKNLSPSLELIQKGSYREKTIDQIKGSGYVIESLEAALWCFYHTDNFRDAILKAVNLGDDADTTAAVCGQIAGAYYGIDYMPHEWIYKLAYREKILDFAKNLYALSNAYKSIS